MTSDDSNAKQIRSIPEGIWWSLITMTTVGYGDKIPVSFGGKIAGSCCAMMGILCMSFPVPGLFYMHFIVLIVYKITNENRYIDVGDIFGHYVEVTNIILDMNII